MAKQILPSKNEKLIVADMIREIKQNLFLENGEDQRLYNEYLISDESTRLDSLKAIYQESKKRDLEYSDLLKRKLGKLDQ